MMLRTMMPPQSVLGVFILLKMHRCSAEAVKPYQSLIIPDTDFAPSQKRNGITSVIRCSVKLAIMEKKSTIKSSKINTAGNQTCLNQSGLGMMFDQNTGQCILGRVGKKIRNMTEATNSLSSNPITVYMNDDTLKTYMLDRPAMVYTNISSLNEGFREAINAGNISHVSSLIQCVEMDINARKLSDGGTVLKRASNIGHTDVVKLLLDHEMVDVNIANNMGNTALYDASRQGYPDIVKLLLDHGKVDVNIANKNGNTALYVASHNGHTDIVKLLLDHGKVDVNIVNNNGNTALSYASSIGKDAIVQLLHKYLNKDEL